MTSPEQAVINPVEIIQDQLGINEAAAADFANIQIICPGKEDEASSLGDFMTSDHGSEKGALRIIKNIAAQVEKGESPEEALVTTLGMLAVVQDPETVP
jgi:hypothetical protein